MDSYSPLTIRREVPGDEPAIRDVVYAAFVHHPEHPPGSEPTEHAIVDALRAAHALTLSLVADDAGEVVGHVAFSRVLVDGTDLGWYGLGPLAVRSDRQRRGIGGALVQEGVRQLRALGATGVVLVGNPKYYSRFGFSAHARLTFADVPPEYFLCLPFGASVPVGAVTYDPSFSVSPSQS